MASAIFERDGEHYLPTELARSPWDPGALHGGAPAALLAQALGAGDPPGRIARLVVEFLRPVPVAPLALAVEPPRGGRQVQRSSASLSAGGVEVARAAALHLREKPLALDLDPGWTSRPGDGPPPPREGGRPPGNPPGADYVAFHNGGMEIRFVRGGLLEWGPATTWFRLAHPLVAGEEPTPLARVAAACDFGNGVSAVVSWATHTFINPDLTIHLHREPRGEWVCIDAVTRPATDGTALAEAQILDEDGPIGRSQQTLLIDERGG